MRKQKGFTLVELLTVISIIALLLGILLPAINGVRKRARTAVCLSNLRQWGLVYKMYTDEFDGKLPQDYGESPWYYPIRNYYSDEKDLLLCPTAKKPSNSNGNPNDTVLGGTFSAWGPFTTSERKTVWDRIGSYGLNGLAYEPKNVESTSSSNEASGGGGQGAYSEKGYWQWDSNGTLVEFSFSYSWYNSSSSSSSASTSIPEENSDKGAEEDVFWKNAYMKNSHNVPLILDCGWAIALFDDKTPPPESGTVQKVNFKENYSCIDRHNGGINVVFMDFSTRKVDLKELWTLKWHKQFNTAGPWTQAGGVLPEQWPKWMRKYKDY